MFTIEICAKYFDVTIIYISMGSNFVSLFTLLILG